MSRMLVGLDEVLTELKDGPLPAATIARDFGLNPLDARLLMLHAHVRGLVRRNDWGEWAITHEGREALTHADELPSATRSVPASQQLAAGQRWWRSRAVWHYGWQRGAVMAAGAAACLAVAGVAGAFVGLTGSGTASSQSAAVASVEDGHGQPHAVARHFHKRASGSQARPLERVIRSETYPHRSGRSSIRSQRIFEAQVVHEGSSGKAGASTASVRNAFGRAGSRSGTYLQYGCARSQTPTGVHSAVAHHTSSGRCGARSTVTRGVAAPTTSVPSR